MSKNLVQCGLQISTTYREMIALVEKEQIFSSQVLQAYKKGFLIVSDDLSFTKYVKEQGINIISSVNLLFLLYQKHRLSKSEANYCLERLKPFIRKSLYEEIKKDLGGQ